MEWMFQYKIKGDTEIRQEIIDLNFIKKPKVIKWWKINRNAKKDKELINCSNNGELNIRHRPLEGADLAIKNAASLGSTLSQEQITNSIIFSFNDEELLRMEPGKFIVNGKELKDPEKVYEGFVEFIQKTQKI